MSIYHDFLPDDNFEKKYFEEIAKNIKSNVAVVSKNFGEAHGQVEGEKIILMNGDEAYRIPIEVSDPSVKMIFKEYCHEGQHEKLRPIPLGSSQHFVCKENSILDRKYDVSFVGQIVCFRRCFFGEIPEFLEDEDINSFFGIYQGFNRGLDSESYSKILSDTKIAICPHGTASPETFRFFEAAKASCVIICAKQPDNWIYRRATYIERGLDEHEYDRGFSYRPTEKSPKDNGFPRTYITVKKLLSNPEMLLKISNETGEYYKHRISPSSVASYIDSQINIVHKE